MYEVASICGEPRIERLRQRLTGPELTGWINYIDQKQRQLDKVEYYLAQLTLTVAKICGNDLDPEDVLIDWDAGEESATAKLPPEELALLLGRCVGAVIIDKREGKENGKDGDSGDAGSLPDREIRRP